MEELGCIEQLGALFSQDWPPKSDFAELLPRHFEDLMRALPQPDYTRRDGSLNLASRLPVNMLPPDLGPKVYAAYGCLGAATHPGVEFGTTCLHLDMADAVNLLVYVQPTNGRVLGMGDHPHDDEELAELEWLESFGTRAGAVWDIWRAEDTEALTAFLWQARVLGDPRGVGWVGVGASSEEGCGVGMMV